MGGAKDSIVGTANVAAATRLDVSGRSGGLIACIAIAIVPFVQRPILACAAKTNDSQHKSADKGS